MLEAKYVEATQHEDGDVIYKRPLYARVDERVVLEHPGFLESLGYRFVKYPGEGLGFVQYWARPFCIWVLLRGWEKLRRSYWGILKFLHRRGLFHLRPEARAQCFQWRNVRLGSGDRDA